MAYGNNNDAYPGGVPRVILIELLLVQCRRSRPLPRLSFSLYELPGGSDLAPPPAISSCKPSAYLALQVELSHRFRRTCGTPVQRTVGRAAETARKRVEVGTSEPVNEEAASKVG